MHGAGSGKMNGGHTVSELHFPWGTLHRQSPPYRSYLLSSRERSYLKYLLSQNPLRRSMLTMRLAGFTRPYQRKRLYSYHNREVLHLSRLRQGASRYLQTREMILALAPVP